MSDGIKELAVIIGCILGMALLFGMFITIIIGIPAAAIVWIIEAFQS